MKNIFRLNIYIYILLWRVAERLPYIEDAWRLKVNPLTPNDHHSGRTAPLTSKRSILYIYSTNTSTEYFKRGIYSPIIFLFKMQFVS
jgi:hypothetical protein